MLAKPDPRLHASRRRPSLLPPETFRGRDLLVMIDGVPMNTPLRDVSRILPMIDLNTVERIEVVAGASSLYGSGATGGTVNFITRKPTDGKPAVSVNAAIRAFTANPGESSAGAGSLRHRVGESPRTASTISSAAAAPSPTRPYDGEGRERRPTACSARAAAIASAAATPRKGRLRYRSRSASFEVSATWIWMEQDPQWMTALPAAFRTAADSSAIPIVARACWRTPSRSPRVTRDTSFALGELERARLLQRHQAALQLQRIRH